MTPTPAELEAFLDESLPPERMAAIEEALRDAADDGGDASLRAQLAEINGRRDAGLHSLGAVWRQRRLTCPTREQLGSYLLGVLDEGHADYVKFHLEVVACRSCLASLGDLKSRQQASEEEGAVEQRRRRYFQSSVGRLSTGGK